MIQPEKYNNKVPDSIELSVCVQAYNHASYIKECLGGLLNQVTTFNFEILLGEDDSTDDTRQICIDFAKDNPNKIRLFLHDRSNVIYVNDRPTGRFNFIYNLTSVRGKYIAICEGDDYWTDPYKLQKQVDFLESNDDFVMCSGLVDYYYQESGETKHRMGVAGDYGMNEMFLINYVATPTVLFRAKHLNNEILNKLRNYPLADFALWIYLLQFGKLRVMDDVFGVYRLQQKGVWSLTNQQEKLEQIRKQYYIYKKDYPLYEKDIRKGLENYELLYIHKESIQHKTWKTFVPTPIKSVIKKIIGRKNK